MSGGLGERAMGGFDVCSGVFNFDVVFLVLVSGFLLGLVGGVFVLERMIVVKVLVFACL
jgi:hypothetical protein